LWDKMTASDRSTRGSKGVKYCPFSREPRTKGFETFCLENKKAAREGGPASYE